MRSPGRDKQADPCGRCVVNVVIGLIGLTETNPRGMFSVGFMMEHAHNLLQDNATSDMMICIHLNVARSNRNLHNHRAKREPKPLG